MGAALADDDAPMRPAASVARLLGAPIDGQAFRVRARLPVNADVVAEAGAAVDDPLAEHLPNGAMQASHVALVQAVGRLAADGAGRATAPRRRRCCRRPAMKLWSSSRVLSFADRRRQPLREAPTVNPLLQRLRAMAAEHLADAVAPAALRDALRPRAAAGADASQAAARPQPDAPELAHVAVSQLAAVGQREDDARVRVVGRPRFRHDERAGHAQRHGHDPSRPRGAAGRSSRAASPDGSSRRRSRRRTAPAAADGGSCAPNGPLPSDRRARHPALEIARDGLDFGQLGMRGVWRKRRS